MSLDLIKEKCPTCFGTGIGWNQAGSLDPTKPHGNIICPTCHGSKLKPSWMN